MPQLGIFLGLTSLVKTAGATIDGVLQAEVGAFLQTEGEAYLAFD